MNECVNQFSFALLSLLFSRHLTHATHASMTSTDRIQHTPVHTILRTAWWRRQFSSVHERTGTRVEYALLLTALCIYRKPLQKKQRDYKPCIGSERKYCVQWREWIEQRNWMATERRDRRTGLGYPTLSFLMVVPLVLIALFPNIIWSYTLRPMQQARCLLESRTTTINVDDVHKRKKKIENVTISTDYTHFDVVE